MRSTSRGPTSWRRKTRPTELLLAVLPRRLVEQYQRGDRELAEAVRNATMIAVYVEEPEVGTPGEQEILAEHAAAISAGLVALAEQFGVEHLGSTATQALYAVGLQVEGEEAGPAVAFAAAAHEHGSPRQRRRPVW